MYFSSVVLACIGNPPGVATEIYVNHTYTYQVMISDLFQFKKQLTGGNVIQFRYYVRFVSVSNIGL